MTLTGLLHGGVRDGSREHPAVTHCDVRDGSWVRLCDGRAGLITGSLSYQRLEDTSGANVVKLMVILII